MVSKPLSSYSYTVSVDGGKLTRCVMSHGIQPPDARIVIREAITSRPVVASVPADIVDGKVVAREDISHCMERGKSYQWEVIMAPQFLDDGKR